MKALRWGDSDRYFGPFTWAWSAAYPHWSVTLRSSHGNGERLTAKTRIEECEWHFGTGCFKWLSWFRRPKVRRSLDIEFSGEVGRDKGSWNGGVIGTSIDMLPGELHEAAFRRYCEQEHRAKEGRYRIKFLSPMPEQAGPRRETQ